MKTDEAIWSAMAWAASGIAQADDLLKAKVGVLRLSSSAPVFIAQDKGYFGAEGLDVVIEPGNGARAQGHRRSLASRARFRVLSASSEVARPARASWAKTASTSR